MYLVSNCAAHISTEILHRRLPRSVTTRVTRLGEFSPISDCLLGGRFFNSQRGLHFWATFSHSKGYVIILTNNRFGYNLGHSFTNSSGHPGNDYLLIHGNWWLVYFHEQENNWATRSDSGGLQQPDAFFCCCWDAWEKHSTGIWKQAPRH
jgi:hypothetical protein